MSSKKISELPQLTTAEQSDVMPIVNTNETKQITKLDLLKEVVQSVVDVDTKVNTKISDSPLNSKLFGRRNGNWTEVVFPPSSVLSVNTKTGVVVLTAADVGADVAGSALVAKNAANDYTDSRINTLTYPVTRVNTQTGDITLTQDDIGDGTTNKQYTITEKNKLATISENAQKNVQSDWNATSGDSFILNKPTIGSGTVTSVATGTGLTGGPITSSGTIALNAGSIASLAKADTAIQNLAGLGVTATAAQLNFSTGVTSAIQTQLNAKAPTTSPTFATSIIGSYLTASQLLITDASKKIISAPVATYPSLTELTYLKGVTSSVQSQLTGKQDALGFTAENVVNKDTDVTLAGNSDTKYPSQKAVKTYIDSKAGGITSITAGTGLDGGTITTSGTIELNAATQASLAKADTAVQDISGKQNTITGGATTIVTANLTSNRALLSDASGKVAVSAVTNTELGYVSGATSNIQTQLNARELLSNKTTDGTLASNSDTKYPSEKAVRTYVANSKKLSTISLDFVDLTVETVKARFAMKINSITTESGTPTIKVNGTAYTFGTTISQFTKIEVTGTVDTLVILNIEAI